MSVVAIGEPAKLEGFALAGVEVIDAEDGPAALRAWEDLPADVELVLLSEATHDALAERLSQKTFLWVVLPG
ncbi:MAG: hypothetical protein ACXVYM_05445 [Gaiellaceae bacterium]